MLFMLTRAIIIIQHIRSPPYHPLSNGQAESFCGHLQEDLSEVERGRSHIRCDIVYRSTRCLSLPGQKTPAETCIGRQLRIPISDRMQNHLDDNKKSYKEQQTHKVHRWRGHKGLDLRRSKRSKAQGVVIRTHGTVLYDVRIEQQDRQTTSQSASVSGWSLQCHAGDLQTVSVAPQQPKLDTNCYGFCHKSRGRCSGSEVENICWISVYPNKWTNCISAQMPLPSIFFKSFFNGIPTHLKNQSPPSSINIAGIILPSSTTIKLHIK